MKKRLSRINTSVLSFVLAAAMVMGLSGMTALAAESDLDSTETETQTIIVKEWGDGNTPEGAVYPYHLCQVTKAFYPIDSMDDIVTYEPGAGLSYTIYDSYTDEEIGIGTTDEEGGFSLQVDQYAEFTVEADTTWYVNQDDPEDSPLLNVTADGRHATVVDEYNGVVQHTPDYDKSKLEKEYNNDLLLDESDYTEESWAPFAEALEKAKEVLDDDSATQDEIDQALEDLENAKDALKKAESESGQPDPTPSPDPDPDPEPEPEPTETVTISTGLEGNEKAYDGESVTLTAKVNDLPENAEVSYQWYKDGTEIEGAAESTYTVPGNVSDSGTYKCVVTIKDGTEETTAEDEVELTITKAVQEISFETDSVEKLDYDEPFIHPLIETNVVGAITYTSSDESIATVDSSTGEVTIHGTGIAIITATAAGDDNHAEAHAFYTLLVNEDILQWEVKADRGEVTWDEEKGEFVDNLSYTGDPIELTLTLMLTDEEKEEIEAMSFQWYRFNPETQEFDAIEGAADTTYTLEGEDVNAGTYVYMCEVTANYRNGRERTVHSPIEINIAQLAQSISYDQTEIAKTTDDEPFSNDLIIETISPEDGAGITYMSSDTTVATVDENGLVTLLGAGTATITATAAETTNYAEASASYTLTVSEPASKPEQPEVSDVKVTSDLAGDEKTYDGEGITLTVMADVDPEDAEISYQWYKDDEPIDDATDAKLVLDGNVSDSGMYTCVVTAEKDGLTASAEDTLTITIEQAAQDISYEQAVVLKMDYDGSFINDLTETVVYGQITYSSSDQTVATVDSETGTVAIKGNGQTTITATAAGSENYAEAEASYTLLVNTDEVAWEVDVNHDQLTWDAEQEEWVADLTYNGDSLGLEMIINLSEAEQAEVRAITYQWYRFVPDTQEFEEIDGATEDTLTLEGDAVNAGDYRYMCMSVVTYNNGNAYTIYSPIEIVIEKALQEISYQETGLNKTTNDKAFTNPLTETTVDMDGGADITYESSDETIATVDESGEVTILAAGDVTITATVSETANYEAATASYTLLIEEADEPWETVQYAVRLWGINRDVDEEGNVLGLTFGPATGASYIDDYEAHLTKVEYEADDEAYCIHWMTWDEIIAQSATDPTVFSDCLENGCTKAVELTTNGTIFNSTAVDNALEQGYTGDGVGTLYYLLNGTGAYQSRYNCGANWNYATGGSSNASFANVYSQSRIRVTLNGDKSDAWLPFASSDNGADLCDEYDCLLSCFPVELQTAIVPRETINAGQPTQGVAADDKTTYDKLWLLSMAEVGLSSISDDSGGTEYGITTSSDSRKAYEFSGKDAEEEHATTWWLRSRYSGYSGGNYVDAYFVTIGGASGYGAASNTQGLSPCFCLAGPKEPTVEVTITATGDTDKTYDGNGISLTAHATVTPEETNVTCQWYKDDVPIEGANYSLYNVEGNVSDSGIYKCVVTAKNGAGETSAEAEVLVGITPAEQNISYEVTDIEKTLGDPSFINQLTETVVSTEEGAGIVFNSSNENIATVDEEGLVTIHTAGTVTITATAAATANYAEAAASYTLKIREAVTEDSTAFAVYSAEDYSLTFYCGTAPSEGDTYYGKEATNVYTDVDTLEAESTVDIPWTNLRGVVTSVVIDESFAYTKPINLAGWFYGYANASFAGFENMDTSAVTSMMYMFDGCTNLTSLAVSDWDTSSLTSLYGTFDGCTSLTELDVSKWDTSNVNTLYDTFSDCTSLTTLAVENWDTSNVTTMGYLFYDCTALTGIDVSGWETGSNTSLYATFYNCSSLTSLDLSGWVTSNVTNLSYSFYECSSMTSVGDLSEWNTANVTDMGYAFNHCSALTNLDISGWDTSSVTTYTAFATYCSALEWVKIGENTGIFRMGSCVSQADWYDGPQEGTLVSSTNLRDVTEAGQYWTFTTAVSDVEITSNVENDTKSAGRTGITLTADATYTPDGATLAYQWYRVFDEEDQIVEGAEDKEYTTGNEVSDSGTYKCIVTVTYEEYTATGSGTIDVTLTEAETGEPWENVQYAVKIWGIGTDTYSYDGGDTLVTAGLTFGPATGDNADGDGTGYIYSYKAHMSQEEYEADDEAYCIHWMTWEEIIAQSEKDPVVFTDCLNNGCTKAVELTPNDKLFNSTAVNNALNQNYTGDGVSTLYYLLNGAVTSNRTYGATWNYSSTSASASDPANVYSRSQVRTTLTGDKTNIEEWRAGSTSRRDYYNQSSLCDETNCLLTCFPEELQDAIVPRTTLNTGNAANANYESIGDITTYDKLFLFSLREIGTSNSNDDSGGSDYGVNGVSGTVAGKIAYEFSNVNATAVTATAYWTRSRYVQNYTNAYIVNIAGSASTSGSFGVTVVDGISPGFCLPGPEGR